MLRTIASERAMSQVISFQKLRRIKMAPNSTTDIEQEIHLTEDQNRHSMALKGHNTRGTNIEIEYLMAMVRLSEQLGSSPFVRLHVC